MKRKSLESPNGESNKPKIQHEKIPRVKTKPNSTQKQRQLERETQQKLKQLTKSNQTECVNMKRRTRHKTRLREMKAKKQHKQLQDETNESRGQVEEEFGSYAQTDSSSKSWIDAKQSRWNG
jgi:hypothetical protein